MDRSLLCVWFCSHRREMMIQCKRTPAVGAPLTSQGGTANVTREREEWRVFGFIRPHKKKQSCFSSPPSSLLGAASLFFFFFFFFYKNADNALEIELKRSKIEMPLSFLKDFYTWNMFRHVFVQMKALKPTHVCITLSIKDSNRMCSKHLQLKRVDLDRSLAKKKKKPKNTSLPHQILKTSGRETTLFFYAALVMMHLVSFSYANITHTIVFYRNKGLKLCIFSSQKKKKTKIQNFLRQQGAVPLQPRQGASPLDPREHLAQAESVCSLHSQLFEPPLMLKIFLSLGYGQAHRT